MAKNKEKLVVILIIIGILLLNVALYASNIVKKSDYGDVDMYVKTGVGDFEIELKDYTVDRKNGTYTVKSTGQTHSLHWEPWNKEFMEYSYLDEVRGYNNSLFFYMQGNPSRIYEQNLDTGIISVAYEFKDGDMKKGILGVDLIDKRASQLEKLYTSNVKFFIAKGHIILEKGNKLYRVTEAGEEVLIDEEVYVDEYSEGKIIWKDRDFNEHTFIIPD